MKQQKIRSLKETQVLDFLEKYRLYRHMLDGNRRARTYFAVEEGQKSLSDDALLKARMMAIRRFVMTLPDCREKMLLYYRYLFGYSVERCAELMDVSRRTAFRIADEAIRFAAENYDERETF